MDADGLLRRLDNVTAQLKGRRLPDAVAFGAAVLALGKATAQGLQRAGSTPNFGLEPQVQAKLCR